LVANTCCRRRGYPPADYRGAPAGHTAQRQVRRARIDDRVTLGVADAQRLPFADGIFDAVICESVTAFVPDKPRAMAEYVRVTRPGGYVGLAEGTWLAPPPPELAAYLARVMDGVDFQRPDMWRSFLAGAGLIGLVAQRYPISARRQWRGEMGRLGRDVVSTSSQRAGAAGHGGNMCKEGL
jgi:SAM-dependent methyltransferase